VTSGDYLQGFLRGTRSALYESGRESITITIPEVNAFNVGALIELYERAVGFYASIVNINAYHQPGVEAGKKAAGVVIDLQRKLIGALTDSPTSVGEIAAKISSDDLETLFKVCEHLAANGRLKKSEGLTPFEAKYSVA
ncbi:MAG: Glucose-6-phosphate isomerase, partial [Verrucomicrobiales bacterium]|nr:Glucose-6-phosphate isomerase [Verrucomicrobiales bacterium]